MLLLELLSDLIKIDDILLIIKNNGATSEIRSDSLSIRQKDKWITIGDNDGPAHMHLNSELIKSAEFIQEQKPEKLVLVLDSLMKAVNVFLQHFLQKCMMIQNN